MNTQDELNREKRRLEHLKKEHAERLPEWEKKVQEAESKTETHGKAGKRIYSEHKERFDLWQGTYEHHVEQAKQRIEQLQGELDQQSAETHKNARAELDEMKASALTSWLAKGGTKDGFDQAWPQLEQDLLKQQTLESLTPADLVKSKRARYSGI